MWLLLAHWWVGPGLGVSGHRALGIPELVLVCWSVRPSLVAAGSSGVPKATGLLVGKAVSLPG